MKLKRRAVVEAGRIGLFLSVCLSVFLWNASAFGENSFGEEAASSYRPSRIARARQLAFPELSSDVLKPATEVSEKKVDSSMSQHWGLASVGFYELFSSVGLPSQKTLKPCSNKVVVAVVDTGIDYTHPDLKDSLWKNPGEVGSWQPPKDWKPLAGIDRSCRDKSCNGIDDDKNGFEDDVIGWDFVHNVPLPWDVHGHGTHISGIIASQAGNGVGIAGVCPAVSIMALKYYDNSVLGYSNLQNTVRAIKYAIANGAHIINYSGGGSDPAPAELKAVEAANQKGILFVAAAGNNGQDNDWVPYYPASYHMDNIISVASTNQKSNLLPSSNFGVKSVDIAAPGVDILSTLPQNRYGTMSGTSQATAFVTGAAALLVSQYETIDEFSYKMVKRWLVQNTTPVQGRRAQQMKGGVLSVPKAITAQATALGKAAPAVAKKE